MKWLLALVFAAFCATTPAGAAASDKVVLIDLDGAVSVAAARQLSRAVDQAKTLGATAIVMQLDTPGGLVSATRDIVKTMIASPIPIIVYVGPSGARAASAGTFIVYAAHLAAMAPGTNLGAATPISIGGIPGLPQDKTNKPSEPSTAERKSINDAVALLRSLAQLRGRDPDFADKAVREAATLTAGEARKQNVVEIVADSVTDLLNQADGRTVSVNGVERSLATKNAAVTAVGTDWRTRLLAVIADPNVAFILLLIGVYGILIEFFTPGVFAPGVVGTISLVLALIALSSLPVQYGALGLILVGVAMMVGEAFVPSGALAIGGVIAFVVGALFLFEPGDAQSSFALSLPIIAGAAVACAAISLLIIGAAIKARKRPAVTGGEQIIGSRGRVVEWQDGAGIVHIAGERWSARGQASLSPGANVRVVAREGLTVTVQPE